MLRKKGLLTNLKKAAMCCLLVFCMLLGLAPSVKAEAADYNPKEAAEALKTYILNNGTADGSMIYITRSYIDGMSGEIEYIPSTNHFRFNTVTVTSSNAVGIMTFDYDLSANEVDGTVGYTTVGHGSTVYIVAQASFSTNYYEGKYLSATLLKGDISRSQASNVMTSGFKASMNYWNMMIEDVTNDKYNIGNLGFTRYVTPKASTSPVPTEPAAPDGAQNMYRLYNPNSGEHFYTANTGERNDLIGYGWKYEGVGWTAPITSDIPVFRLYNPNAGDHHYTKDASERDFLVSVGWNYEGIGWYSADDSGVPLYRQYNPNAIAGAHNYTTDAAERDMLVGYGWKDEGIGWYGV